MTSHNDPSPSLAVVDLECFRGDQLLFSGLNFKLGPSQYLQIEGANGSGKTSLLRLLAALSLPNAGEVRWRGLDIQTQRSRYFAEMAYLGHLLGIKGDLTPFENLKVSMALGGLRCDESDLYGALEQTGLEGREDMPARSLSAGQKQRIALARLLVRPAALWILDEPFTALDVSGVALVTRLIEEHLASGGMAVMTSHQAIEVRGDAVKVSLS